MRIAFVGMATSLLIFGAFTSANAGPKCDQAVKDAFAECRIGLTPSCNLLAAKKDKICAAEENVTTPMAREKPAKLECDDRKSAKTGNETCNGFEARSCNMQFAETLFAAPNKASGCRPQPIACRSTQRTGQKAALNERGWLQSCYLNETTTLNQANGKPVGCRAETTVTLNDNGYVISGNCNN